MSEKLSAAEYALLTGQTVAEVDADVASGVLLSERHGWRVLIDIPEPEAEEVPNALGTSPTPTKAAPKKKRKNSPSARPVPGVDG